MVKERQSKELAEKAFEVEVLKKQVALGQEKGDEAMLLLMEEQENKMAEYQTNVERQQKEALKPFLIKIADLEALVAAKDAELREAGPSSGSAASLCPPLPPCGLCSARRQDVTAVPLLQIVDNAAKSAGRVKFSETELRFLQNKLEDETLKAAQATQQINELKSNQAARLDEQEEALKAAEARPACAAHMHSPASDSATTSKPPAAGARPPA